MKKVISLIIISVMLISCAFACSCGKSDVAKDGLIVETMTDFESVNEIMSLKVSAAQSQLSLNTDKKYISSGESSLKMEFNKSKGALNYYEDNIVQFIPRQKYFEKTDFRSVVGFTIDIWNENDYEIEICLSVNNRATVLGYSTLEKGYNSVSFTFDNEQVFAFSDVQLLSVDLSFYSGRGNDLIYMDNVRLTSTDKEFKPYDFKSAFKNDVNYTYDNFAQLYTVIDLGGYDSIFSRARLSVNYDKSYVKIGDGSMKVEFQKSPKTGKVDNTSIRTYDKMSGNFNDYVGKGYYLKADVFNATDKAVGLNFKVFSTIDDETFEKTITINANSWSDGELSLAIDDIKKAFTTERLSVLTVVFGFYGVDVGDAVYVDNLRFERSAV